MTYERQSVFDQIEGLRPVDPADLEDFKREMEERTIPAIEAAVRGRQRLADEVRSGWREFNATR